MPSKHKSKPEVEDITNRRLGESIVVIEEKATKSQQNTSKFSRKIIRDLQQTNNNNNNLISNNKKDYCIYLLTNGYVQSYIDFYYLTHGAHSTEAIRSVDEPNDLLFIQNQLIQSEISRRQGNTNGVFNAYKKLADFYISIKDWHTSVFFYEKFLEIAQLTMDTRAEMSSYHELGCVYYKMGIIESARKYHEKHEDIAYSVDVLEEVAKANSELYKVFLHLAKTNEDNNNFEDAIVNYNLSLESAKKCLDKQAEADANGSIGNLLLQQGKAEESLPYLSRQAELAADMGFSEGRCKASSALALAYDRLNRSEKALAELNLVHTISEQEGDIHLQAKSSKALGSLLSKLGRLNDAVTAFERHYELIKTLLSNKTSAIEEDQVKNDTLPIDLEIARSYVAISKGNHVYGSYIIKIDTNLNNILDWKISRNHVF